LTPIRPSASCSQQVNSLRRQESEPRRHRRDRAGLSDDRITWDKRRTRRRRGSWRKRNCSAAAGKTADEFIDPHPRRDAGGRPPGGQHGTCARCNCRAGRIRRRSIRRIFLNGGWNRH
jgi:hypothetical protein